MRKAMILSLIGLLLINTLSLTACNQVNDSKTPVAVAIVIGNRHNSKKPNLNSSVLTDFVRQAVSSAGFISWTEVEGDPQCQNEYKISTPNTVGLSKEQINRIYTQQTGSVLSTLTVVKAKTPEADLLQSLNLAVRSLVDAQQNSSKQIIVLDSGLSTKGALNFTASNFLDADPNVVANYLLAQKDIPDFSGITVTFIGLGDTALPQQPLSGVQKVDLKNIWCAIVEKGGGKASVLDCLPGGDGPTIGYPTVTSVKILSNFSSPFDKSSEVVFRNIEFTGDTTTYSNPEKAINLLQPVANYMKAYPEFSVLIVGTTAGDHDKDYCLRLSSARSSAVGSTLISLGVSANQIKAIGLGFSDIWHIPDTNLDGTLIESAASKNRKVVMLDTSSAEAQSIIAKNN